MKITKPSLLAVLLLVMAGWRTPRAEDAGDTDQRLIERVSTLAGKKAILLLGKLSCYAQRSDA
jgi:hypothetical protein